MPVRPRPRTKGWRPMASRPRSSERHPMRLGEPRGSGAWAAPEGQTRGGTPGRLLGCLSMRRLRPIIRPIARLSGDLLGLVPALLAGAGVFLLVAGLFYYLQPVAAESSATASAGTSGPIAVYSLPPLKSPGPSGS